MPEISVKDEARRLIDQMSDEASWEDLVYQIYVRQAVEAGLEDCMNGRVVSHEDVKIRATC